MGLQAVTTGLQYVQAKGKVWGESIQEMHDVFCTEPVVAGSFFTVAMGFDVTFKMGGCRKMDEIAVFEVKDGKIIKEQFFF